MNTYDNNKLTTNYGTEELIYDGINLGITMEQLGEWRIITGLDPVILLMNLYNEKILEKRDTILDNILKSET